MQICRLKSNLRRATVTGASPDYEGSLTISSDLAELVGCSSTKKFSSATNGERFETYAIYGTARRGIILLNGATAHLGKIGDRVTIMSFARCTPEEAALHEPLILILNEKNEVVCYDAGGSA